MRSDLICCPLLADGELRFYIAAATIRWTLRRTMTVHSTVIFISFLRHRMQEVAMIFAAT